MNLTVNELPYPIWVLDTSLAVLEKNNLARVLSESPFNGLNSSDVLQLKKSISENISSQNLVFRWKNEERWHAWSFQKTELKVMLFANDVSKIKEDERQYVQILDAIPDLVLVKGQNSKIHWGNKAFRDHYGMSNQELQELIDAPFTIPDYTHQYIIDDAWVWNNKKKLIIECEPVMRHDGVERKFHTIKMPIVNSKNEVIYTVGISRDITEYMENRERSYAAAKMASLGEMAGAIAHEINNPIAVIMGKARHLRKALDSNVMDKVYANTKSIEDQSERIAKIVHNLLSFCREEQIETFELTSFNAILDQALSLSNEKMKFHDIRLHLDIEHNIKFECMNISISQILLNLINNAIDSVVEVNMKNPWIKISAHTKDENLEVRVSDSGPGVSDAIAVKIMQPFFTTKPVGKGTGLGLSISQSMARAHGGSLVLDRQTSSSCFLLTVPLMQKKD